MGQDKTKAKKIQEYYNLSCNYLESAKISLKKELFEPAMFSAIHALELALKAVLFTKTEDAWNELDKVRYNINYLLRKLIPKEIQDLQQCLRIIQDQK